MIIVGTSKRILFKVGKTLDYVCPVLATVFGVVATYPVKPELEKTRPIVHYFYSLVYGNLFWLLLILLGLYLLGKWLVKVGDAWILDKLQFILDQYQYKAFTSNEGVVTPKDHNRVTLFKYKSRTFWVPYMARQWKWFPWYSKGRSPFAPYLLPVLRSGRLSKKTDVAFYVPDSSDHAEGVAGLAWVSGGLVEARDLPEIRKGCAKEHILEYAERTQCGESMIQHYVNTDRKMPRCIVAIPVERSGKDWGVVVLDSRYPEGVSPTAAQDYKLTIALIGHLLERL